MSKQGFVYMMSSQNRNVLYVGVTSDLEKRVYQHKQKLVRGFTQKYHCVDLVWWGSSESIESAIQREKQLKGWSRSKKNALIETMNPGWVDLSEQLFV